MGEGERLKDPKFFQLHERTSVATVHLSLFFLNLEEPVSRWKVFPWDYAGLRGLQDILARYFSVVTTKISCTQPLHVFLIAECPESSRFDKDLSRVQG